jgi:cytochrome c-type biogenesis protein CcmF
VTGTLGAITIAAACALTLGGIVAAVRAARHEDPRMLRQAERIAYAIFALVSVSTGAMVYALVTHDFSVSYVAHVGSLTTPFMYSVLSLWGALEGSLLLWAFVLALFTALVAWRVDVSVPLLGYSLAVLMGSAPSSTSCWWAPRRPSESSRRCRWTGRGPTPCSRTTG